MDYSPSDIDRLIARYLSRRASKQEEKELQEWLHASEVNQEVFNHLSEIWSVSAEGHYHADMDQVRDRIWKAGTTQKIPEKQPVQRSMDAFYWSKVAATFLIFFLGAWFLTYLIQENASLSVQENTTLPPAPVAWVEQLNPAGQKSTHRLPDGTMVWLNADSRLTYPEKFTDTLRLVQLQGEAFFEVAQDRQRPFIVEAGDTRTQALGTVFNIHAYPEDHIIKIALLEGKVRVQDLGKIQTAILSPGEELLVPKDKTAFSTQSFAYENTFGWKDGILIFDGVGFDRFRRIIEKWYGVNVEINGPAPDDWHIRARYQNEDLRHVLRDICFNKNIEFKLHDKNVLLTF